MTTDPRAGACRHPNRWKSELQLRPGDRQSPQRLRTKRCRRNIGTRCLETLAPARLPPRYGNDVLSEIPRHMLRVSCRRSERTVEIQTVDAVRLCGGKAVWKDVAQRLLDDTCQQRTGRREEDGCWPALKMP